MKKNILKLTGIVLVGFVLIYLVAGLFMRSAMLKAHTPFTLHQIVAIHREAPIVTAISDSWVRLPVKDAEKFLTALDSHVIDWNSTSKTKLDLIDSWGSKCLVEVRRFGNESQLRLTSPGPDKQFRTTDDILVSSELK